MMFIQCKIASITNSIYHRIYIEGYHGRVMPRSIRKIIAGTQIHRAWFLGYNHYFEEDGIAYGLARPYAEMLENLGREEKLEEETRLEIRRQENLDAQKHARITEQDRFDIWREYNS